jgi:hypothetical protein
VTPLEAWDYVVDGKSLFAARDDADFASRLARAAGELARAHGCSRVWLGGGGALREDLPAALSSSLSSSSLSSSALPFSISPRAFFVAAPGGFALARTNDALVVDVGQTAVKVMWRGGELRHARDFAALPPNAAGDFRAAMRCFIVDAVMRATPPAIECVVLALPAEVDDALVPGACSYPGFAGDATLVRDVLAAARLDRVPALILNDAELAAVSAREEWPAEGATLVLTVGYGVGAAIVRTPAPAA